MGEGLGGLKAELGTPETWGVVLAAGSGTRMSSVCGEAKQFLCWRGEPLYMACARTFAACVGVRGLVFVFPEHRVDAERQHLESVGGSLGLPWRCVAGGERRQDSVRNALAALPVSCKNVLVHDSARPFVSAALTRRVLLALNHAQGVIPGVAVTDTIKRVENGLVTQTLPREALCAVQTPQGFSFAALQAAHQRAEAESWNVTDDAALLERCGLTVAVVEGELTNCKITNPEDLDMLHVKQTETRVGYGYDVHRYVAPESSMARPLKIGGVLMDGNMAVQAHSDGDVLLHALMDALLGCIGGGDIGQLFPDNNSAFSGVNSAVLLDEVLSRCREAGFTPTFMDLTVIAQKPKIGPKSHEICANVARLAGLPRSRVNVKATTEEGLGFTGAVQGLKAVAVVTGTYQGAGDSA